MRTFVLDQIYQGDAVVRTFRRVLGGRDDRMNHHRGPRRAEPLANADDRLTGRVRVRDGVSNDGALLNPLLMIRHPDRVVDGEVASFREVPLRLPQSVV